MKIYFILVAMITIISCNPPSNNVIVNEASTETPKALQENDEVVDIKSYSRSVTSNLVEELYQEMVSKNEALKKLESDLELYIPKITELNELYNKYNDKSINYYQSASDNINNISDSVLKQKMTDLIKVSNQKYIHISSEYEKLSNQITKNNISINDYHVVLKLVLTLPLIEKYQLENKPNKKSYLTLINEQQKLLFKIENLTKNK